jgi:hypothetical protein
MKTLDQRGLMNLLLIPFILLCVFFVGAAAFGYWAFMGRQDYKNNSDRKAAEAVAEAIQVQKAEDKAIFDEAEKKPLDTYIGPAAFGNITVKYPKTWSAYVQQSDRGSSPVNGYFHPSYVPDTSNSESSYALRVQLVQQSYDSVINTFNGQITTKKVTVEPYKLEKVPNVVGAKVEGQIKSNKQGTMIVLPLRNMTLEIWTESNAFKNDLENIILKNMTFVP